MLPLAFLVTVVVLVALAGGMVVWMVLAGAIAPEVAAGGSAVVMACSFVALGLLFARMRARRTERDIHTIRRSQSVRERQPLRYALDETPDAGPDLVRPLPEAQPPEAAPPEPAAPSERRLDERTLAAWLEPVVAMPLNETDAWRVSPGDGTALLRAAALPAADRVEAELWTVGAAMRLAPRLDAPVMCELGADLLGDRDAALELRRLIEAEPSLAASVIAVCDLASLDVLGDGRLDDLVEAGVGLALAVSDLPAIDRAEAAQAAERGARYALVAANDLDGPMAARSVRALREAGVETIGVGVPDEDAMLRLADLGIMRFTGPAFGEPRRARAVGEPEPGPTLPRAEPIDEPETLPSESETLPNES